MKVLVVVDMQNDFIDGALGTREAQSIVPKVCAKIKEFDGIFMVTYDTHYENYLDTQEGRNLPVKHCIKGSHGWQINSAVSEAINDRVLTGEYELHKFTKETFGSVELAEELIKLSCTDTIEEVILVGLCTDICVISNAMIIKAFLPEVKITVDAACCAGVTPISSHNALEAMRLCQINIEN